MRSLSILVSTSVAILALLPAVARATPTYPGDVQTDLSLTYVPPCTICHQGPQTQGTATTAFALAMKAHGLLPLDDGSVQTALRALQTAKIDSDANGTPDVQQIEMGCDPSTDVAIESGVTCGGTSAGDLPPVAAYGCGAQLAPGATGAGGTGLLAAVMLVTSLARRRRRGPRGGSSLASAGVSGRACPRP